MSLVPNLRLKSDKFRAALKRMVGGEGTVVGIDTLQELVDLSRQNIEKDDAKLLNGDNRIILQHRDGWKGAPDHAPFNAIHVGAAARELPKPLVEQ